MTTLRVQPADLRAAQQLLRATIRSSGSVADVAEGSSVDELIIGPAAMAMALMRADVRAHELARSRRGILSIEDEAERDQSARVLADNLFLPVGNGRSARGQVRVALSRDTPGVVPVGAAFTAARGVQFKYDADAPLLYSSGDLLIERETDGRLVYVLFVPVIAAAPGTAYNVDAVVFSGWTTFSPFITGARSSGPMVGGSQPESAAEILERLPTAITVRNLISQRSIMTQLVVEFASLSSIVVVKAGDPEMVRDQTAHPGLGPVSHHGGCVDVYVHAAPARRTLEIPVGDAFGSLETNLVAFRDMLGDSEEIPIFHDVLSGDVLRLVDSYTDESSTYLIEHADLSSLEISSLIPFTRTGPAPLFNGLAFDATYDSDTHTFSIAADETMVTSVARTAWVFVVEADSARAFMVRVSDLSGLLDNQYYTEVTVTDPDGDLLSIGSGDLHLRFFERRIRYSIGRNAPDYDNLVPLRDFGQISSQTTRRGAVAIHGVAVGLLQDIVLLNPNLPDVDPLLGGVRMGPAVSTPPAVGTRQYRVRSLRPELGMSAEDVVLIELAPVDTRTGNDGTITIDDVSLQSATFSAESASFVVGDVDLELVITGSSYGELNGWWGIVSVDDSTTLQVVRLGRHGAGGPTAGDEGLKWRIDRSREVAGSLRVSFDTIGELSAVHARLSNDETKVAAVNTLARAFFPVVLSMTVYYEMQQRTSVLFDATAAARILSQFVGTFPAGEELNTSDIVAHLRSTWPQLGNVIVPSITYQVVSPTGAIVSLTTTDAVRLDDLHCATSADILRLASAAGYGLSNRTARMSSRPDLITMVQL